MDAKLIEAVKLLVRVTNAAGRARETSAAGCPVADIPVGLLKLCRDFLEQFRDTELGTAPLLHATNRVW